MEEILPTEYSVYTHDGHFDALTQTFMPEVCYEALQREISYAKRENKKIGIAKFSLNSGVSLIDIINFANRLNLAIRMHDLIARMSALDFMVLFRSDDDLTCAFESLLKRLENSTDCQFHYSFLQSEANQDYRKTLQILEEVKMELSS
mgnify:CR=1 FL=1